LQAVVAEAWGYIGECIALMSSLAEPFSGGQGELAAEALEPANAAALAAALELAPSDALLPMANVDPRAAELAALLREKMLELVPKPSVAPQPGAGMAAGVYSAKAALDLVAEELSGNPEAEFLVRAEGFENVGVANVRLTFKEADVAVVVVDDVEQPAVAFALPASLDGLAMIAVTDRGNEFAAGYRTYSIVISANPGAGSGTLSLADGADLLVATLTARSANAQTLSLVLNYLDVVYHEDADEAFATSSIAPSVATVAIRVSSRFDVNRDGAVTLLDVDAVRRLLGSVANSGEWATDIMGRCDLDGNGAIDIADLTAVIATYEASIP
jgi:hypothetical protein